MAEIIFRLEMVIVEMSDERLRSLLNRRHVRVVASTRCVKLVVMVSRKKLKAAGKGLAALKIARSAFKFEYIDPKEGYREAVCPGQRQNVQVQRPSVTNFFTSCHIHYVRDTQ